MKKEYLLLILIVSVSIFLSAAGLIGTLDVYADYDHDIVKEPALSLVMRGIHDGISPFGKGPETDVDTDAEDASEKDHDDDPEKGIDSVSENGSDAKNEDDMTVSANKIDDTDKSLSENGVEEKERSFTTVDDDYFSDALFVGDSRIDGLSRYVGPIDERADFYTKTALTIYNLKDGKSVKTDMGNISLWDLLEEKTYGKIYLMVGLNEIGTGDAEYFKKAYAEVIDGIREREPDAIIFINGIIHFSAAKSASDPYFNNPKINERNAAIASLADNKSIFYIDVNEAFDDGAGNLRADITFDEVHLKGSCYDPWYQYLLSHGIK